jgi:Ca2+-binding RTX toxin-like protein
MDIDTLIGGKGADQFFFDTPLNSVTNVDMITRLQAIPA